jgi:hypothetical protein
MLNTFSFVGVRNNSDLDLANNAPPAGMGFRQKRLFAARSGARAVPANRWYTAMLARKHGVHNGHKALKYGVFSFRRRMLADMLAGKQGRA